MQRWPQTHFRPFSGTWSSSYNPLSFPVRFVGSSLSKTITNSGAWKDEWIEERATQVSDSSEEGVANRASGSRSWFPSGPEWAELPPWDTWKWGGRLCWSTSWDCYGVPFKFVERVWGLGWLRLSFVGIGWLHFSFVSVGWLFLKLCEYKVAGFQLGEHRLVAF